MKKQSGFTFIELVVVIALLGILGAVALPRFVSVTDDAHNAAVKGAAGGFAAGVALAKAKAVVENAASGAGIQLDSSANVIVNGNGYPVGASVAGVSTSALTPTQCIGVWDNVLQSNRPAASNATASGVDYVATVANSVDCIFTYRVQNTAVTPAEDRTITYESDTGDVTVAGTDD